MGEKTKIEWTATYGLDGSITEGGTYNPWWGCTKLGEGCKNCYAEAWSNRMKFDVWGANKPRRFFPDRHWNGPVVWNRKAEAAGVRRKVFCGSMMDVLEIHKDPLVNEDLEKARARLWELIEATPNLDWLLLTKRIGSVVELIPWASTGWPDNVWLGFSASNQDEFDRMSNTLFLMVEQHRPKVLFVSLEPLLGPVNVLSTCPNCNGTGLIDSGGVTPWGAGIDIPCPEHTTMLDWLICGGESCVRKPSKARPMHPGWVERIRDDCKQAGVPLFFKQFGEWAPGVKGYARMWAMRSAEDGWTYFRDYGEARQNEFAGATIMSLVGKENAGDALDGEVYHQFPSLGGER